MTKHTCPYCGAECHSKAEKLICWRCRKIIPTCASCKYKDKGKLSDKCFSCEDFNNWEEDER